MSHHHAPPGLGEPEFFAHEHAVVAAGSGAPERVPLHLNGVLLPDGEVRDLWVSEGVIRTEPVAGAVTVCRGAWIMPGLVDAHCHIGLGARGAVPAEVAEDQARTDRDAGTLLIRDAGSPVDSHWIDERPDLPRIIRAGRHIARPMRYIRNYAEEVDPDELVAEVERQARRGDGWVKLVGDWIDRNAGDLAPLWPAGIAAAAIARAHELGVRVTAHCFGEESVHELVRAGIDGIEHGTGLDDSTIALMAERGVALVPTLVNLENFPGFADAGEAKFPAYASHMRALHARRLATIGAAVDAGVPVFAGTDAGGTVHHGLIGTEIELLAGVGGTEFALGAASWRARAWLGAPPPADGGWADLVAYAADPRLQPEVTRHPSVVILRGRVVVSSGSV
ncbi:amidohydrolase family protein [Propionicimonas sp.]|uniref:amidohydrolase family protein n=1 Tax=Propionicimonas sp. TaxID=1955623 RepID=UPI0039E33EF0